MIRPTTFSMPSALLVCLLSKINAPIATPMMAIVPNKPTPSCVISSWPNAYTTPAIIAMAMPRDMIVLRIFSIPVKPLETAFKATMVPTSMPHTATKPRRPVPNWARSNRDSTQTAAARIPMAAATFNIPSGMLSFCLPNKVPSSIPSAISRRDFTNFLAFLATEVIW